MQVNILDKFISYFNPKAGLQRVQRRAAIDVVTRSYEGARKDRRTAGWRVAGEHEEVAKLSEIKTLKSRSIDLYRNNPYSFRAHNSIANNITGTGILPAIKQERLKKVWNDWATDTKADFDENLDFYGLQNLCAKTLSVHGEVLILRVKTNDKSGVPLELKVISTRYLDTSRDTDKTPSGGYIIGGVEFSEIGKRKGYWIYPKDPHIDYQESTFWKDEDVIHLFRVEEPGQIHGVPLGSSSMMSLRNFDDYADAQLMRQKIAACFSVFVTEPEGILPTGTDEDEIREKVEPGLIEHLSPGKSVTFASPPPAEGYGEYSRNVLTGVAAGYGAGYETVTGDLSNVNYSSGRMGWIEYQRNIETYQWFILIPKLCRKVWIWFIDAAIIAGKISKNAPVTVDWTAPGRKMIDPVKEINGLLAQVRAGFMSWQEAVRTLGYTPEEVIAEMKISADLFDKEGLRPKCDPRYDTSQSDNNADTNTDRGQN